MRAVRTPDDLYVASVTVEFRGREHSFQGLIDTGSNICCCSYKVITALHAKPTSYDRIANPFKAIHALGYSLRVGFDEKLTMTHVYRLPLELPGIDMILGQSILSKCEIFKKQDHMEVKWAPGIA